MEQDWPTGEGSRTGYSTLSSATSGILTRHTAHPSQAASGNSVLWALASRKRGVAGALRRRCLPHTRFFKHVN